MSWKITPKRAVQKMGSTSVNTTEDGVEEPSNRIVEILIFE